MSEAKNTALGSWSGLGYSHTAMITVILILTALVLVTSWDSEETERRE